MRGRRLDREWKERLILCRVWSFEWILSHDIHIIQAHGVWSIFNPEELLQTFLVNIGQNIVKSTLIHFFHRYCDVILKQDWRLISKTRLISTFSTDVINAEMKWMFNENIIFNVASQNCQIKLMHRWIAWLWSQNCDFFIFFDSLLRWLTRKKFMYIHQL